jgi:hypothetical protein
MRALGGQPDGVVDAAGGVIVGKHLARVKRRPEEVVAMEASSRGRAEPQRQNKKLHPTIALPRWRSGGRLRVNFSRWTDVQNT